MLLTFEIIFLFFYAYIPETAILSNIFECVNIYVCNKKAKWSDYVKINLEFKINIENNTGNLEFIP